MKDKYIVITGTICVVLGVSLLSAVWFTQHEYFAAPAPAKQVVSRVHSNSDYQPARITISDVGIAIPVQPAVYDNHTHQWVVNEGVASYVQASYTPNDRAGTVLLYAHAKANAFGNLKDMHGSALAIVTDKLNNQFTYMYHSELTHTYDPNDTSIFSQLDVGPRLVLLTCEGWLSQVRVAYVFLPVR